MKPLLWVIWGALCVATPTESNVDCPANCTCQPTVTGDQTTTTVQCTDLPETLPNGASALSVDGLRDPVLHVDRLTYTNLRVLNLSDSGVVGFEGDAERDHLWNLRTLLLSRNKLLRLNVTTFAFCGSVEELALDDNLIKSVAQLTFAGLTALRHLDLAGNRLMTLQFELPPSLVVLDASNNQLEDSALIGSLPKLVRLNLCGNDYNAVSDFHLPKLSVLCMGDAVATVHPGSLSDLPGLTNLTIVGKHDFGVAMDSEFQNLERLASLTLSYLQVPKISSQWLEHFPALRELHLTDIQSPGGFESGALQAMANLTILDLRRSPTLVDTLLSMMTAEGSSQITMQSFAKGSKAVWLDISENPLKCNSNLRELLGMVIGGWIRLSNANEVRCAEPSAVAGQRLVALSPVRQILAIDKGPEPVEAVNDTNSTNSTATPAPPGGIYYYLDHWGITTDHLLYIILGLAIVVLALLMALLIVAHLKCRQRSNYRPQRDGSEESFMMRADSEYTFDNFTLSETMAECRRSPNSTLNKNRKAPSQK